MNKFEVIYSDNPLHNVLILNIEGYIKLLTLHSYKLMLKVKASHNKVTLF